MTKKAIVNIDLEGFTGDLQYLPGLMLPRRDKRMLETRMAMTFLSHMRDSTGFDFENVEWNANDPPDVFFTHSLRRLGIELTELLPVNRIGKDARVTRLRREILSHLRIGSCTKNHAIHVSFRDDYACDVKTRGVAKELARAIQDFLATDHGDDASLSIPASLQGTIHSIRVLRQMIGSHPHIEHQDEPLITFGLQNTLIVPEDDCPAMVAERLDKKGMHDLALPTWLVVWSNHHSLLQLRNELDAAIAAYLRNHPMKYERIFHLHLFSGSGATEFSAHLLKQE